jgi:hypothetical protein
VRALAPECQRHVSSQAPAATGDYANAIFESHLTDVTSSKSGHSKYRSFMTQRRKDAEIFPLRLCAFASYFPLLQISFDCERFFKLQSDDGILVEPDLLAFGQ